MFLLKGLSTQFPVKLYFKSYMHNSQRCSIEMSLIIKYVDILDLQSIESFLLNWLADLYKTEGRKGINYFPKNRIFPKSLQPHVDI